MNFDDLQNLIPEIESIKTDCFSVGLKITELFDTKDAYFNGDSLVKVIEYKGSKYELKIKQL